MQPTLKIRLRRKFGLLRKDVRAFLRTHVRRRLNQLESENCPWRAIAVAIARSNASTREIGLCGIRIRGDMLFPWFRRAMLRNALFQICRTSRDRGCVFSNSVLKKMKEALEPHGIEVLIK